MKRLSYIISRETNPYHNIALEEYLLNHVQEGECILYLWQNRKTVVIGYNQNAWRECRVETLEADGGHVARRLSGGGAVFHDLGNLNFTFLARKKDYDVGRQSEVILRAVQSFGLPAVRNGRNDLTVDGRKFSGNAFYRTGDFCYHHGTILIRSDKAQMGRYLTVSKEKLQSKGVESVKSRVVNLEEYVPGLSVEQMETALLEAFGEVYKDAYKDACKDAYKESGEESGGERAGGGVLKPEPLENGRIDSELLQAGQKRFASWEWLYGRKIPFQYEAAGKYPWGEVQIQLEVSEGIIRRAVVWSDALDVEFPRYAEAVLTGVRYRKSNMERVLQIMPESGLQCVSGQPESDEKRAGGCVTYRAEYAAMMSDIISCLTNRN